MFLTIKLCTYANLNCLKKNDYLYKILVVIYEMRLELTRVGLLVKLASYYTTGGVLNRFLVWCCILMCRIITTQ